MPPTSAAGSIALLGRNEQSIEDGNFGMWRAPADGGLNLPSDRHGRGSTASFFDGHVRKFRWRVPKPYAGPDQDVNGPQDRQDLRDLQAAIPDPL